MEPDACTTAPYDGGQTASALNIVVADDDVLLREELASPLDRPGFKVAGQAADATEVLSLVGEHRPDLVVVDIYS
jgi:DNA-binding NarL/FixJ family response regulator